MGERHWYDHLGNPRYGASLEEARNTRLAPSYSEIEKLLANFGLQQWMVNNAIKATAELAFSGQIGPHADADEIVGSVQAKLGADRDVILDAGTEIHDLAEQIIQGRRPSDIPADIFDSIAALELWIDNLGIAKVYTEQAFCRPAKSGLRYGGRMDTYGVLKTGQAFLIDWKSQDIKPGKIKKDGTYGTCRPNFYSSFARQHYGYRAEVADRLGVPEESVECYSVLISKNPHTQGVYQKVWSNDELEHEGKKFELLLQLFYLENKLPMEV